MSELKTNKISTNDQNNVAIDNALGLKSYDTTARNALTSVTGDMIYNTTDSKVQVYNGSAWEDLGGINAIQVDYVVIGGGGAGTYGVNYSGGAGGGAGGYLSSYNSESSGGGDTSRNAATILADGSTTYRISIGAGSTSALGENEIGTASEFLNIAAGGGSGGTYNRSPSNGAGGGAGASAIGIYKNGAKGILYQGFAGGTGTQYINNTTSASGGGAGAGSVGEDGGTDGSGYGGDGGSGVASTITGSSVIRAGGGGGSGGTNQGSAEGGGGAAVFASNGNNGAANTGGGGGGTMTTTGTYTAGLGGSGVVILRWATADATITPTRTGLIDGGVQTDGSDSYIVFTSGTGTISFS